MMLGTGVLAYFLMTFAISWSGVLAVVGIHDPLR